MSTSCAMPVSTGPGVGSSARDAAPTVCPTAADSRSSRAASPRTPLSSATDRLRSPAASDPAMAQARSRDFSAALTASRPASSSARSASRRPSCALSISSLRVISLRRRLEISMDRSLSAVAASLAAAAQASSSLARRLSSTVSLRAWDICSCFTFSSALPSLVSWLRRATSAWLTSSLRLSSTAYVSLRTRAARASLALSRTSVSSTSSLSALSRSCFSSSPPSPPDPDVV
mmetsp:Transcript_27466/g.67500  ORF Transcript_27466/g.67500 Transcript_27466/m.67500 type:complete len:232 (-) Transcript_27466:900-1595(-)